jgi:hypothetical protein
LLLYIPQDRQKNFSKNKYFEVENTPQKILPVRGAQMSHADNVACYVTGKPYNYDTSLVGAPCITANIKMEHTLKAAYIELLVCVFLLIMIYLARL